MYTQSIHKGQWAKVVRACILCFFRQITIFVKVHVAFVFGLQTLWLIDFSKIYWLKCAQPKNKDNRYKFLWGCFELTKKYKSNLSSPHNKQALWTKKFPNVALFSIFHLTVNIAYPSIVPIIKYTLCLLSVHKHTWLFLEFIKLSSYKYGYK